MRHPARHGLEHAHRLAVMDAAAPRPWQRRPSLAQAARSARGSAARRSQRWVLASRMHRPDRLAARLSRKPRLITGHAGGGAVDHVIALGQLDHGRRRPRPGSACAARLRFITPPRIQAQPGHVGLDGDHLQQFFSARQLALPLCDARRAPAVAIPAGVNFHISGRTDVDRDSPARHVGHEARARNLARTKTIAPTSGAL